MHQHSALCCRATGAQLPRRILMPQKIASPVVSPWSWQAEEEPGIRIPYHVIRHASGRSGPVRIQGLELTRAGDVVLLRAVNTRGQTLPQFIEVPLTAEVLRHMATELEAFATQAEADTKALHRRRRQAARNVRLPGSRDPR